MCSCGYDAISSYGNDANKPHGRNKICSSLAFDRRELELIGSRIELLSGRERGSVSSVANWLVAEIGNANELSIELSIGSRTGCDRVASWNKLRSG
ncbi:hypothetical protein F2Q68_00019668 [Brassica cretica]|uniref:Uncharacterized protein n=1 Tax=Brassica cretica TaxID=69181 RepID=A0A3N6RRH1_BRACR|nr:hypothetical protein F2Q68_00019668 [Brassica cretica]